MNYNQLARDIMFDTYEDAREYLAQFGLDLHFESESQTYHIVDHNNEIKATIKSEG